MKYKQATVAVLKSTLNDLHIYLYMYHVIFSGIQLTS